jgi:hypothetical protein
MFAHMVEFYIVRNSNLEITKMSVSCLLEFSSFFEHVGGVVELNVA